MDIRRAVEERHRMEIHYELHCTDNYVNNKHMYAAMLLSGKQIYPKIFYKQEREEFHPMTRKFIFPLVLISAGFLAICGCSKVASSTPYVNGSDIIRQKLGTAIDGYPESVQSVLREIVLQEG